MKSRSGLQRAIGGNVIANRDGRAALRAAVAAQYRRWLDENEEGWWDGP